MISSHAKSETNQNAARIGRGREWRRPWRCWLLVKAMAMALTALLTAPTTTTPWEGLGADRQGAGVLIFYSFFLCEIRLFFLSFYFEFFLLLSSHSHSWWRMAWRETCNTYWDYTVAQNSSFPLSLSLSRSLSPVGDFIDFLHAPWRQEMSDRHVTPLPLFVFTFCYSLFLIRYSLFVLFVLHIRIE